MAFDDLGESVLGGRPSDVTLERARPPALEPAERAFQVLLAGVGA